MAITPVTLNTKFNDWRLVTNQLITILGDNTTLTTNTKTSLVAAINEIDVFIGNLSSLGTLVKTDLVNAINEVLTKLGDVSALNTSAKVAAPAINELLNQIGLLTSLTTTDKTSIVNAINEVQTSTGGDLSTLTTTNKSSIISAINEVDGDVGDLSTLTTTAKGSTVAATNELDSHIGDLSTLTTTAKTSLVAAANELDIQKLEAQQVEYSNSHVNGGRFATDNMSTIVVSTFNDTGLSVEYNSATFAQGEKFVNDNSDNGGAGAALSADTLALLAAMATRTNKRYGYEFYILDITAGSGTNDQETFNARTFKPVVQNNSAYLGPINKIVTFACWIRLETLANALDNGIVLGDTAGKVSTKINGIAAAQQSLLTTTLGWVHLKQNITLTSEFHNIFPAIFGNSGDVINIALPVFTEADYSDIHVGLVQ